MTQQANGQPRGPFNPNEHLMQIKSKQGSQDYLPVQWRLVWFNEICPQGKITILDQLIDLDREITKEVYVWNQEKRRSELVPKTAKGYAWFRVRVEDGHGKVGEAFGSECAVDFDEYAEKADTKATGRALAKIGYGTQFAPEFDEEHRIVDSPVDRGVSTSESNHNDNGRKPIVAVRSNAVNGNGSSAPSANAEVASEALASDQQLASIRKICEHLGKAEPEHPETMSFANAKELIAQLSQEYRQSRKTQQDQQPSASQAPQEEDGTSCTIQQVESIRKLCQLLKQKEPQFTGMTFAQARDHINRLNRMNASRRAS